MSRGDWLFLAVVICALVLVFWALFGKILAEAIGGR